MGRKWTVRELADLENMFSNGIPDDIIAKQLQRTQDAVRIKRKRSGIIGDHNARRISVESRKNMADARRRIPPELHPSWKGGRRINHNGYVEIRCKDHHRSRGNAGYVFEHILVLENKLGRKINADEHVHHKDHNKQNNDPDNLEVLSASEHSKKHIRPRKGLYISCVICGTVVYRKLSHAKKSKCCNLQCVGVYNHLKHKGEI